MIPIHRRLAWFATASPDAPAVSDAQGALDFAGAHRLARSMAAAIAASGLALGDRIALVAANRREALLGFMAASATGGSVSRRRISPTGQSSMRPAETR